VYSNIHQILSKKVCTKLFNFQFNLIENNFIKLSLFKIIYVRLSLNYALVSASWRIICDHHFSF